MTDQLPDPLVPAHVDLTGYEFMPLYGARLFDSDFNLTVTDKEFRVGLRLWWKAWQQVPAASLPGDEVSLCKLAGFDSMAAWKKVRAAAMRNFLLCSDGRYYHTVLAPLAIEAYSKRVAGAIKGKKGAAKRWAGKMAQPVDNDAPATEPDSSGTENDSSGNTPTTEKNDKGQLKTFSNHSHDGENGARPAEENRTAQTHPPNPEARSRIIAECRRANVHELDQHLEIVDEWIALGATATNAIAALAEAREQGCKPYPEVLPIRYVTPIIKRYIEQDQRAREVAHKRDEATQKQLAEQRAWKPEPKPKGFPEVKKRAAA